jgi:hypothetical protein
MKRIRTNSTNRKQEEIYHGDQGEARSPHRRRKAKGSQTRGKGDSCLRRDSNQY